MTRQSRHMSMLEAAANVGAGYVLAILTQLAVFPAIGLSVTLWDSLRIGAAFMVVSLARSYVLRRVFERLRGH